MDKQEIGKIVVPGLNRTQRYRALFVYVTGESLGTKATERFNAKFLRLHTGRYRAAGNRLVKIRDLVAQRGDNTIEFGVDLGAYTWGPQA